MEQTRKSINAWGSFSRFAVIPGEVFGCRQLRAETFRTLVVLLTYVNFKTDSARYLTCWPSIATMSKDSGVSRRAISRGLCQLRALGLVVLDEKRTKARNGQGLSSVYSFRNFMSRLKELEAMPADGGIVESTQAEV